MSFCLVLAWFEGIVDCSVGGVRVAVYFFGFKFQSPFADSQTSISIVSLIQNHLTRALQLTCTILCSALVVGDSLIT